VDTKLNGSTNTKMQPQHFSIKYKLSQEHESKVHVPEGFRDNVELFKPLLQDLVLYFKNEATRCCSTS